MRGAARIEIGAIARAHGIRGEVAIFTHDPDSATLGEVETIWVGGIVRTIKQARSTHRGWLVALDGVMTRNDAEALQGAKVEVDRDALGLGDDDVLLSDLVGCAVRRVDGSPYGTVAAIDASSVQELLVIHDGDIERLLPMVDVYVLAVDIEAGVITVDPPDGLPESKRR
jgi:16S rRNA processing protein RimM